MTVNITLKGFSSVSCKCVPRLTSTATTSTTTATTTINSAFLCLVQGICISPRVTCVGQLALRDTSILPLYPTVRPRCRSSSYCRYFIIIGSLQIRRCLVLFFSLFRDVGESFHWLWCPGYVIS